MTYSAGNLILATDYNGFVSTNASANVNDVWATGASDKGWGQSALGTVSAAGSITATQWASLVNTLSSMGSQTGTAITSRTAPTAGNLIQILANVNILSLGHQPMPLVIFSMPADKLNGK